MEECAHIHITKVWTVKLATVRCITDMMACVISGSFSHISLVTKTRKRQYSFKNSSRGLSLKLCPRLKNRLWNKQFCAVYNLQYFYVSSVPESLLFYTIVQTVSIEATKRAKKACSIRHMVSKITVQGSSWDTIAFPNAFLPTSVVVRRTANCGNQIALGTI